jgi:hypothetical protein
MPFSPNQSLWLAQTRTAANCDCSAHASDLGQSYCLLASQSFHVCSCAQSLIQVTPQ